MIPVFTFENLFGKGRITTIHAIHSAIAEYSLGISGIK